MKFLSDKFKPKKEIAREGDFYIDPSLFKPFALLQETQLDDFVRGLLKGNDSLYDKAYEQTGNKSFTERPKGRSNIYKTIEGFEEYTYLAAFEALLCGMFPCPSKSPCAYSEYGQGKFFDENGFVVKYLKEKPLYERNDSRDIYGDYLTQAGIVQILYQSPIGNFVIKQNQVNSKIFEIYVSEDISELLLGKLSKALEISLDIKENDFRQRYRVELDTTSPNIGLQKPIDTNTLSIEDSRSEV